MTIADPAPLPQSDLDKFFPLVRPKLAQAKTYEVGLTLAGTVSAGAYTAGVLDYLVEALDAWTRAKEDGAAEAPRHNVVISTLAGASGGAINGAIFTRLAGWAFPHGADDRNPFYQLWVKGVDLTKLLQPQEKGVTGFASIFNTQSFADLAADVIAKTGDALGSSAATPRRRSYLADPLRLFMMVANITGVPYQIYFRGQTSLSHNLMSHADFIRQRAKQSCLWHFGV